MSDTFVAGDIAVCVDDAPRVYPPLVAGQPWPMKRGSYWRVIKAGFAPSGDHCIKLAGIKSVTAHGWSSRRFRKLDAPRTEIADLIRACKPADNRVPA